MNLVKIVLAVGLLVAGFAVKAEDIVVYRSPTCGCCEKWLAHLQENGFTIDVVSFDHKNKPQPFNSYKGN